MNEKTRRMQFAATLPKKTWAEWRNTSSEQMSATSGPVDIKSPMGEGDQIITGKAPPMVPPAEDFSTWTKEAIVREMGNELTTAFVGGVLGIPIALVGLLMVATSSVEWRSDSPAGIVAGGFILLMGGVIVWLFRRRWSGLRYELQRRNAAAARAIRGLEAGERTKEFDKRITPL